MEVKVTHDEKMRFRIQARQHVVESDQPVENGGDDSAMTPPELLLAAIGSCAAFYGMQFLLSRGLAGSELEIKVTAEKLNIPARLGNFVVHVNSPVSLTDNQTTALQRSVLHCLVHQTMMSKPQVEVRVLIPNAMKPDLDAIANAVKSVIDKRET